MNGRCHVAVGEDRYWLDAVERAVDGDGQFLGVLWHDDYASLSASIPRLGADDVLLVDATGCPGIVQVVQEYRRRSRPHTVVARVAPTWALTRALLKDGGVCDVWRKSYVAKVIRDDMERLFAVCNMGTD